MEALANRNPKVRIRKIEVGRGGSPVAMQHGIRSLPHLVMYEGSDQVASGAREVIAKIQGL